MFSKQRILKSESKKDIECEEFKSKVTSYKKTKNKLYVYI